MNIVSDITVLEESSLRPFVATANFHDAHAAILTDESLTSTEILLRAAGSIPSWVTYLIAIRNRMAKVSGLKEVGQLDAVSSRPASMFQLGERFSIFDILEKMETELVLGIEDKHFDVRVSVFKTPTGKPPRRYVISTVVKVHNRLGGAYMAPVRTILPFVVRAVCGGQMSDTSQARQAFFSRKRSKKLLACSHLEQACPCASDETACLLCAWLFHGAVAKAGSSLAMLGEPIPVTRSYPAFAL